MALGFHFTQLFFYYYLPIRTLKMNGRIIRVYSIVFNEMDCVTQKPQAPFNFNHAITFLLPELQGHCNTGVTNSREIFFPCSKHVVIKEQFLVYEFIDIVIL